MTSSQFNNDSKDLTQRFMNLQDEFKVFFDVDMNDEEGNAENEKEDEG